jgi:hypothetical protein
MIRDRTNRDSFTLSVSASAWLKFTSAIKYRRHNETWPVTA